MFPFLNINNYMRVIVDVLTAVTIKNVVFWVVTSSDLIKVYRRFGGTYYLHLQSKWLHNIFVTDLNREIIVIIFMNVEEFSQVKVKLSLRLIN
jgi:hypothetical protein